MNSEPCKYYLHSILKSFSSQSESGGICLRLKCSWGRRYIVLSPVFHGIRTRVSALVDRTLKRKNAWTFFRCSIFKCLDFGLYRNSIWAGIVSSFFSVLTKWLTVLTSTFCITGTAKKLRLSSRSEWLYESVLLKILTPASSRIETPYSKSCTLYEMVLHVKRIQRECWMLRLVSDWIKTPCICLWEVHGCGFKEDPFIREMHILIWNIRILRSELSVTIWLLLCS